MTQHSMCVLPLYTVCQLCAVWLRVGLHTGLLLLLLLPGLVCQLCAVWLRVGLHTGLLLLLLLPLTFPTLATPPDEAAWLAGP